MSIKLTICIIILMIMLCISCFSFVLRTLGKCLDLMVIATSFRALQKSSPIRLITSDEYHLLIPYLTDPSLIPTRRPQKKLVDRYIHQLKDISITKIESQSVQYRFMDNIPMVFPYGLDRYLQDSNSIVVVFTKQAIIAVQVNNISLLSAKKNLKNTPQYAKLQWLEGDAGIYKNWGDDVPPDEQDGIMILSQRQMTLAEQWLFPNSFGLINRIKGKITQHDINYHQITLNHTICLYYPAHWQAYILQKIEQTQEIEADVIVNSYEIISLDHTLSVENETESFGKKQPLMTNFAFSFIGMMIGFFLFAFMPFNQTSLIYTYNQFFGHRDFIHIADNAQLHSASLNLGDWVDVQGVGECNELTLAKCNSILVDRQINPKLDTAQIHFPDWIYLVSHNKLQIEKADEMNTLMTSFYKVNINRVYQMRSEYDDMETLVSGMQNYILAIDGLCRDTDDYSCDSLQRRIEKIYQQYKAYQITDWASLVQAAQSKAFINTIKTNVYDFFLIQDTFSHICERNLPSIEKQLRAQLQENSIHDKQITLHIVTAKDDENINPDPILLPYQTTHANVDWSIKATQVAYLYDSLRKQTQGQFRVKGMIDSMQYNEAGQRQYLSINNAMLAQKAQGLMSKSVIFSCLFVMISLLALVQFTLLISKLFCNFVRHIQIKRRYKD